VQNDTTAKQAGEREVDAAPAPEVGSASEPEADAASQPEAAEAEAGTDSDADEAQAEAEAEAEASEDTFTETEASSAEADGETETETEASAEAAGDQVVTERADEEAEQAEQAEAAPVSADGAAIAADLDAARAEAESYLDDLRRLQADFDNYRKRTLREQTARTASASQALVTRLLPVLDNFELAVSAAEQSRDFDRMLKGVEMVLGALREVLQAEGLVKIEAEGKPFDPERHEAVIAVDQEEAEPGSVVDIVRAGYELRGKVLRPAMVKVAK
jgi:molecular chaperone GrpE